ncbi:MAG: HYR domain-containing protein, partial [Acidobacteriota bacterium]
VLITSASNNQVQGNLIGTRIDGLSPLGNGGDGVGIEMGSSNNLVGGTTAGAGNTIANNPRAVLVLSGTGNSILSNSIFDNEFGIDLIDDMGPTPNDTGDADTGANDVQNFPVITFAATNETTTVIQGTLNSTANTAFRVEFFSSSMCNFNTGFGEGKRFLGSSVVTTNGSGNASFNVSFPTSINSGSVVTATATNPSGSTSEFSACSNVTILMCLINCPADQTFFTGPNDTGCGTQVVYPAPQIIGDCGAVNCAPPSGSFFQVGSTQVTCTTEFGPSCSFNVLVVDRTRPNITCPDSVTARAPEGQTSAVVNYPAPTATDNCPFVTVSCSPPSGSVFPLGASTVNCQARDEAINESGCSFTVTVNDSNAPTIQCPANIVMQAQAGQTSAIVNYPPPTVTDNLPGATATCAPASGSSFPLGVTTVTCTATDADGNRAMCGFTITINSGPPTARVTIDGGKNAVEFGTQAPITPRRKPPRTDSPCSFFTIENTGSIPLTLTYVSVLRTGSAVTSGRITDPNERGTYTLSTINSQQAEQEVPPGTVITIGVGQSVRFCLRFDPLIPAVETSTNNLRAPSVIPDFITSACNFTIQGGPQLSVNVEGNVAETLMLINPDNPRKKSTVTFARSGNEFILTYSIFDPDLDTSRARYELLNSNGQIVGQPIEVDLARAISETGLLTGQSFTVDQRFTGANSHPEITGCDLTVTDGEGSVSKRATSVSSSASLRRRGRLTLTPRVIKIGR